MSNLKRENEVKETEDKNLFYFNMVLKQPKQWRIFCSAVCREWSHGTDEADRESVVNNVSWTEDDEIKYEAENKERKRKIIQKKLDEAQHKYDEAERSYQDTGSSSTMRTMHRHEDMIMICELALQALDNVCGTCESRRRNAKYAVNKYKEAKESGNNDALNFDNIIADFINLQY